MQLIRVARQTPAAPGQRRVGLPLAELREFEGADHAFRAPKGRNAATELAEALATWARNIIRR